MATDNPSSIKVPKATLYKMVSYKGSIGGKKYTPLSSADEMGKMQGDMGKGFQAVIGGINSLGASINSICLLYTSPSPRDATLSRMPSSA